MATSSTPIKRRPPPPPPPSDRPDLKERASSYLESLGLICNQGMHPQIVMGDIITCCEDMINEVDYKLSGDSGRMERGPGVLTTSSDELIELNTILFIGQKNLRDIIVRIMSLVTSDYMRSYVTEYQVKEADNLEQRLIDIKSDIQDNLQIKKYGMHELRCCYHLIYQNLQLIILNMRLLIFRLGYLEERDSYTLFILARESQALVILFQEQISKLSKEILQYGEGDIIVVTSP